MLWGPLASQATLSGPTMHRTLPDSVLTYWEAWAAGIPAIPNAVTAAATMTTRFMAQRVRANVCTRSRLKGPDGATEFSPLLGLLRAVIIYTDMKAPLLALLATLVVMGRDPFPPE